MALTVLWLSSAFTALSGFCAEPGELPHLAPGVLQLVPAEPEEAETTSQPLELKAISRRAPEWSPQFDAVSETLLSQSRQVILRRPVWQLEFSYKPLRMIQLPVGNGSGQNQSRNIWYLIYRVVNQGRHLAPVPKPDEFGHDRYDLRDANLAIRCFPTFHLRDHESQVEILDQLIPEAVTAIHAREIRDRSIPLYDSVQLSGVELEVSSEATDRGVWAVATWEGVDRRADFISVYAEGLSNAYRWDVQPGDEASILTYKTLQMNFWRPGDAIDEHVGEFRNGLPSFTADRQREVLDIYQISELRKFVWIYRK